MPTNHGSLHPFDLPGGFAPQRFQAYLHPGYEGAFVWSAYWRTWDKVLGVRKLSTGGSAWIVQRVDTDGLPIGKVREHMTPIDRRGVYPRPFDPSKVARW